MAGLRFGALLVGLLVVAAVPAQASRKVKDKAVTLPAWEKVKAEPEWATEPPKRPGFLRFVAFGRSNMANIAKGDAMRPQIRLTQQSLKRQLQGAPATLIARLVPAALQHKVLLRRAEWSRRLTRRMVPGNTLAEAWVLWEVPTARLLDAVDKSQRGALTRLTGGVGGKAWRLRPAGTWVKQCMVQVMESAPPQFALQCKVEMPTQGWKLSVDEVSTVDATGRVVVKVTGEGPRGAVAQVISQEKLLVHLGYCPVGSILVEVHYRKGKVGTYHRRAALLFEAKGAGR